MKKVTNRTTIARGLYIDGHILYVCKYSIRKNIVRFFVVTHIEMEFRQILQFFEVLLNHDMYFMLFIVNITGFGTD